MIYAIHGFLGQASDWDFLDPVVQEIGLKVHKSELFKAPLPKATLREWGEAFTASLPNDDEMPILLGYSLGGRLALHALLAAPDRYRAAIFVSTHPGLSIETDERVDETKALQQERKAHDEAWAKRFETEEWHGLMRAWNDQPVFGGATPPDRAESDFDRSALAQALRQFSLAEQEDLLPTLKKVTTPILWIAGQHDSKYVSLAKQVVNQMPAAIVGILPDCHHRLPWEAAPLFGKTVRTFLGHTLATSINK